MQKCLFLDRDGVINVDYGYVHKISDFQFNVGIFDLVRLANEKKYLVIVVTNQAGIARGYYSIEDFKRLTSYMLDQFVINKCFINKVYFSPYHPKGTIAPFNCDHWDRKPNPGMILQAADEFKINIKQSILVGDQRTDIDAGLNAGIPLNILFSESSPRSSSSSKVKIVKNLIEVKNYL